MKITIETEALKTILYGILSCQCPVTEKTEKDLFREYLKIAKEKEVSIDPFLTIADMNPVKTPLHLFLDFCSYSKNDPYNFSITRNDALRYFSSRYHFDRMLTIDPIKISDPAAHLVSHMMLPVRLLKNSKKAEMCFNDNTVIFHNIFIPPDIDIESNALYGFHFGMILTGISPEQAEMVEKHLNRIVEFGVLVKRVHEVDFKCYQSYGDYFANIAARYSRNFG